MAASSRDFHLFVPSLLLFVLLAGACSKGSGEGSAVGMLVGFEVRAGTDAERRRSTEQQRAAWSRCGEERGSEENEAGSKNP